MSGATSLATGAAGGATEQQPTEGEGDEEKKKKAKEKEKNNILDEDTYKVFKMSPTVDAVARRERNYLLGGIEKKIEGLDKRLASLKLNFEKELASIQNESMNIKPVEEKEEEIENEISIGENFGGEVLI